MPIDVQKMNWQFRAGVHEHTGVCLQTLRSQLHGGYTPVSIRIQLSAATVKALHARLQQAYLKDDVRLVRRTTVLIDLLVHHVAMAVLCERWGLSASCLYDWQRAFLLHGLESLRYRHSGGRRPVDHQAEATPGGTPGGRTTRRGL